MAKTYTTLGDNPKFADVEPLATQFMEEYTAGKVDAVKVVYMRFLSAGQQRPGVVDLLPLSGLAGAGDDKGNKAEGKGEGQAVAYEFSPGPAELLADLIPTTVKVSLFQAFIEAAVSEQIADGGDEGGDGQRGQDGQEADAGLQPGAAEPDHERVERTDGGGGGDEIMRSAKCEVRNGC